MSAVPIAELESRLVFNEVGARQRAALASATPIIGKCIAGALERFYARLKATPATAVFFNGDQQLARARSAQAAHWMRIVSGRFDAEYFESVRRIGAVHARIGLDPRWYIGGYALVLEEVIAAINAHYSPWKSMMRLGNRFKRDDVVAAVTKAALIDMELSISIYFEISDADRQKAIDSAGSALSHLADGNLLHELVGLPASFARLETSFNDALAKLRPTIRAVSHGAQQIGQGSHEIAGASDDLARRAEGNAASISQASSLLSQIEDRVKTTATNAITTVDSADQAITTIHGGRETAGEAVRAMNIVHESAQAIDTVIEGLDKIAFQTRVLAMNAAIEAGRAGEAGKGFAVVADLVSSLAMRAEEEAQRAREGLTSTQAEIGIAAEAVFRVDNALEKISADVDIVHNLLGRISQDNSAQADAISEISAAISAMNIATQQNAAMAEETSAAALTLTQQVTLLTDQSNQFQTERYSGRPPRIAATLQHSEAA